MSRSEVVHQSLCPGRSRCAGEFPKILLSATDIFTHAWISTVLGWNHPVLGTLILSFAGVPSPPCAFCLPVCSGVSPLWEVMCCLPFFSTSLNWNTKPFPHRPSYFSHLLHKCCIKFWDLPYLNPSALCWLLRYILQITNYPFYCNGNDFCSFTFFPCLGQTFSPFLLIFLTLSCLKFCFQQQKLKIKLEKVHQFSCPVGSGSSAYFDHWLFIFFTIIPHLSLLFPCFICQAFYLCRAAVSRFTCSSRQEIMFSPQRSEFPAPKGHLQEKSAWGSTMKVWKWLPKSVPLVHRGHTRIAVPVGFKMEEERLPLTHEFPY